MSDIAELFARDPLDLTDQDLDTIIAKLRASRAAFNAGEKSAGSMKPKATKKALDPNKPIPAKVTQISLDDLDL